MKKILLSLLISLAAIGSTQAQCVSEGSTIIDVFYGFPDLYGSVLREGTNDNADVKSTGPLGGKIEYMLSDNVGLGAVIGYANTTTEWSDSGYSYKVSVPRFRVMGSFNLHFATSDKLDPYFMVAAGYANSSIKIDATDPTYGDNNVDVPGINIAFRTAVGTRYFFNDFLGANVEIGLGSGALIQGGVSLKF